MTLKKKSSPSSRRNRGQKLNAIDLFCGAGGMSLGAARAGLNIALSVDTDKHALNTHRTNFPNAKHSDMDVAALSGKDLLRAAGLQESELHAIIGGPPCQGFSNIGSRNTADPRNSLFMHFFRLVRECEPTFFVAENVPGILDPRNATIVGDALSLLPRHYKILAPITVKASDFGAPTTRTRIFFIGFNEKRAKAPDTIKLRNLIGMDTTVGHALTGLPSIRADWQLPEQEWRAVKALPNDNFFARVNGRIPKGVGDKEAISRYRSKRITSGCLGTTHSKETTERFKSIKPGAIDPVYRTVRLRKDGYCPTLRAGTGPEKGSYQAVRPIHPSSPRVITPREAARLQGFPDWFMFHHTKWHAFRQIGNSVSPIVAEVVITAILKGINS